MRKRRRRRGGGMDFSVKDGKRLWSLVRRQEALADKKRRWLESTVQTPDGCTGRLKRPKFLADAYLAESDIRSEEDHGGHEDGQDCDEDDGRCRGGGSSCSGVLLV